MPRTQVPIRPVQIDYVCDKCGTGSYRPTGKMLLSEPPQFPHKCNECEHEQTFLEKYPTVRYTREASLIDLENYIQQTA